jgi:hypothetical protein
MVKNILGRKKVSSFSGISWDGKFNFDTLRKRVPEGAFQNHKDGN